MTESTHAATTADDGASAPSFAVGKVTLTVLDLRRVAAFYETVVGLHALRADGETRLLGADDAPLLELRADRSARRRSPQEAGLFHTAFLLPGRRDLARWLKRAIEDGTPLAGASDHAVSEALYLSDPEGNGVEIYSDRTSDLWTWSNGAVAMSTERLDVEDLLRHAGDRRWERAPAGTTVGHVHLQAGALDAAEAFYAGLLGLDVTCRYPGATFYAADGYHHHLATNVWNSRGAAPRSFPSTGLAEVELRVSQERLASVRASAPDAAVADDGALALRDPWNTPVVLRPVG
ncbi:MAG: glyoxalase [Ancylobacter novellus]|uniref:Glyoxalase n=1 Tax=Ancylobacter novellus TaxID=921 RepID=A0A2W5KE69_ANCNO|nr:MAG: glyoxalase [Ancylobacter novellus]